MINLDVFTYLLYLLLCRTYYVLLNVRTTSTLLIFARIKIFKKRSAAKKKGTYCTYNMYAGTEPRDVDT